MIMEIHKNGKTKAVKAKKRKAPARKITKSKDYVVIDFPLDGDVLNPAHYAIRVGASKGPVDISIGGVWKPCREAGNYFWFDWDSIPTGNYTLMARMTTAKGQIKRSQIIKCKVK